jgi:cell division protein FtsB
MTPLQWKRLIYRGLAWLLIAVLATLAVLIGFAAWKVYSKGEDARIAHANAEESLQELDERKVALETQLEKLGTDRGVEEEIRKRYQLAKPGEEVVVLVNEDDGAESSAKPAQRGFWESITSWFSR